MALRAPNHTDYVSKYCGIFLFPLHFSTLLENMDCSLKKVLEATPGTWGRRQEAKVRCKVGWATCCSLWLNGSAGKGREINYRILLLGCMCGNVECCWKHIFLLIQALREIDELQFRFVSHLESLKTLQVSGPAAPRGIFLHPNLLFVLYFPE